VWPFVRRNADQTWFDRGVEHMNQANQAWVAREFRGQAADPASHYREAMACFQKAIDINPNHANAWYYLGSTCYSLGCQHLSQSLLSQAISHCTKALSLAPEDEALQVNCPHIIDCAKSSLRAL